MWHRQMKVKGYLFGQLFIDKEHEGDVDKKNLKAGIVIKLIN